MGWTTAKTENADYVLELGFHVVLAEVHEVDAFVIEGNESIFILQDFENKIKQVKKILEFASEKEKPVFFAHDYTVGNSEEITDVIRTFLGLKIVYSARKKKLTRREFLLRLGFGIFLAMPIITAIPGLPSAAKGKIAKREISRKIQSITSQLGITITSLRSAFMAEQAEAIAQLLTKRFGRKPKICIVAGAGHGEIKEFLEHPRIRKFYLSKYPFGKLLLTNIKERKSIEIKFLERGEFKIVEHKLKEPEISRREFFRRAVPRRK